VKVWLKGTERRGQVEQTCQAARYSDLKSGILSRPTLAIEDFSLPISVLQQTRSGQPTHEHGISIRRAPTA
jgi:hypothetical protein